MWQIEKIVNCNGVIICIQPGCKAMGPTEQGAGMLLGATSQGEALGAALVERLHRAVTSSRAWVVDGALSVLYGSTGTLWLDGTQGCGVLGVALALLKANLLGVRWVTEKPRIRYIPSLVTALVTGIVVRQDGTVARFMQSVRFRCKQRIWCVHEDRILLTDACAQCMHFSVNSKDARSASSSVVLPSRTADGHEEDGSSKSTASDINNASHLTVSTPAEERSVIVPAKRKRRVTFKLPVEEVKNEEDVGISGKHHEEAVRKEGNKAVGFRFNVLGE